MREPLVSIIIPVYNVELYLRRCVDSVLNQTYSNIEVILVDDGSPDKCPAICDEISLTDNRVSVIHKQNGGLSSARNAGLQYVKNKSTSLSGSSFVGFVDSDDWIDTHTIMHCICLITEYNADVIQFDISYATKYVETKSQPKETVSVYKSKRILEHYLDSSTRKSGGFSVCRCLFRSSIAVNHLFREGKINEDIDYKYVVLRDCQTLVETNQRFYNYWQEGNSLSLGGFKKRDEDLREAADILADLSSEESYGTIAFLGKVKQARTAFSFLCKIAFYGISDDDIDKKQLITELTKEHRKNLFILLRAPLPLSRRVLALLFAINYRLTELVIRIFKSI